MIAGLIRELFSPALYRSSRSGGSGSVAVGGAISGGVATRVLFDAGGTIGESANFLYSDTLSMAGPGVQIGTSGTNVGWLIGYGGGTGNAHIWNSALTASASNYALKQDNGGTTFLNAAGGTSIALNISAVQVGTITASAYTTTIPFTAMSGTAIPAGGTAGAGLKFSSVSNYGIFFGSGAPSLSAAKGSLYLRSDGSGVADRAFINTDGGTTWTNLVTAG